MHKYKIRYDVVMENRPEGYTKDDAADKGLTDAFVFISILNPDDGSYSQVVMSHDGKENRSLTKKELFKAWSMLGMSLSDEGKLAGWQKACVDSFAKAMRELMKRGVKH